MLDLSSEIFLILAGDDGHAGSCTTTNRCQPDRSGGKERVTMLLHCDLILPMVMHAGQAQHRDLRSMRRQARPYVDGRGSGHQHRSGFGATTAGQAADPHTNKVGKRWGLRNHTSRPHPAPSQMSTNSFLERSVDLQQLAGQRTSVKPRSRPRQGRSGVRAQQVVAREGVCVHVWMGG